MNPALEVVLVIAAVLAGTIVVHRGIVFGFDFIPGDMGDSRLVNLFLEHAFRWAFTEWPDRLWTAPWVFFPMEDSFAMSENVLGGAALYVPWRLLGFEPMLAYQMWFLATSACNFASMYVLSRVAGHAPSSATAAGFLFAYSMPRAAQLGHPQLLVQYYTPLAVAAFLLAMSPAYRQRRAGGVMLVVAAVLLTLQLWGNIYFGWFFAFTLLCAAIVASWHTPWRRLLISDLRQRWNWWALAAVVAAGLCVPLVVPYMNIKAVVGGRTYEDVVQYMPTVANYVLAHPDSFFYKALNASWLRGFSRLNEWHERIAFAGFLPLLAVPFVHYFERRRAARGEPPSAIPSWFATTILLLLLLSSLDYGKGIQPWAAVYATIPGADSIRALSRIVFAILVPLCLIVARFVGLLPKHRVTGWIAVMVIVLENSIGVGAHFAVADAKSRHDSAVARIEAHRGSSRCKAFYLGGDGLPYMVHLDAMWASMQLGTPTINGYSGSFPPGWELYEPHLATPERMQAWLVRSQAASTPSTACFVK